MPPPLTSFPVKFQDTPGPVLHARRPGLSADCFGHVQKTTGDCVRLDLAGNVGDNLAMEGANAMLFGEIGSNLFHPQQLPDRFISLVGRD